MTTRADLYDSSALPHLTSALVSSFFVTSRHRTCRNQTHDRRKGTLGSRWTVACTRQELSVRPSSPSPSPAGQIDVCKRARAHRPPQLSNSATRQSAQPKDKRITRQSYADRGGRAGALGHQQWHYEAIIRWPRWPARPPLPTAFSCLPTACVRAKEQRALTCRAAAVSGVGGASATS